MVVLRHTGVATIVSAGDALFFAKHRMTFLVVTLSCMLVHGVIYATDYLFISSAGVHLTKFSPISASFQEKCLKKIFSVALGVHLAAPMTPHTEIFLKVSIHTASRM